MVHLPVSGSGKQRQRTLEINARSTACEAITRARLISLAILIDLRRHGLDTALGRLASPYQLPGAVDLQPGRVHLCLDAARTVAGHLGDERRGDVANLLRAA